MGQAYSDIKCGYNSKGIIPYSKYKTVTGCVYQNKREYYSSKYYNKNITCTSRSLRKNRPQKQKARSCNLQRERAVYILFD